MRFPCICRIISAAKRMLLNPINNVRFITSSHLLVDKIFPSNFYTLYDSYGNCPRQHWIFLEDSLENQTMR